MMRHLAVALFTSLCLSSPAAFGQFTTVINIPPSPAPGALPSNTQVNVLPGGSIGDDFLVGSSDGSKTNIEFNLLGGQTGWRLRVQDGGVANISVGNIGSGIFVEGGELNVSGGNVLGRVSVVDGGKFSMSGGVVEMTSFGSLEIGDGEASLSGGLVGEGMTNGGILNVTGGRFGPRSRLEGTVNFFGGEFKLNGVQIAGLDSIGASVPLNVPAGSVLTGTLTDGSTFSIGDLPMYHRDTIKDGAIHLHRASVPALGPATIDSPPLQAPVGVRGGQTLNLGPRASLGDSFSVAPGGTLNVKGGSVGAYLEVVAGTVTQTQGQIGALAAMLGSHIAISGGTVGSIDLSGHSTATITGGSLYELNALESDVTLLGGSVDRLIVRSGVSASIGGTTRFGTFVYENSMIQITGGTNTGISLQSGARAEIAGGKFERGLSAVPGSEVNFVAKSFALDGVPIDGLVLGTPKALTGLQGVLTGLFADNTPFEFRLGVPCGRSCTTGVVSAGATVTIALAAVPEPSAAALVVGALGYVQFRSWPRRRAATG